MADARYTRRFGGDAVTGSHVLHLVAGNPEATVVGDLTTGEGVPTEAFDTLIVVNTFSLIFDVAAALATCHDALRPGGVLLAKFEGIASRCPPDDAWAGDFWRFTSQGVRRLVTEHFGPEGTTVIARGNVRTATAMLYGLAAEELAPEVLDADDPDFEVTILVRAVK
jgi:SAM-dependent methyltransferase